MNKLFWFGTLFIFGILFRPPILPIDLLLPLTVMSALGIFYEIRRSKFSLRQFYLSHSINKLLRWSVLLLLLSLVGILVGFLTSSDYSTFSALSASAKLAWTFLLFPINVIYLFIIFQKNNVEVNTILRMVLWATMIQAVMAVAAYLIPEVKNIFISIMQANNWSERWTQNGAADQRMNGFAKSLFDTFGYGMGLLAAVPFLLALRTGNLKYLLTLPFIFIAILVNARTGLIIFGVVVLLYLLLILRSRSVFTGRTRNILIAALLIAMIPISILSTETIMGSSGTFSEYTENDINSYLSFIQTGGSEVGDYGGQADVLFSDQFWRLPQNGMQLFFGTGLSIYGADTPFDFYTDVGYVNSIWYVGIIGTVLFHVVFLWYIWKATSYSRYWKWFGLAAIISILIFQIKGTGFWSANLGISATILLLAVCEYERRKEKKYDK